MRISILTLLLELSVYTWLYVYRYQEMFASARDIGEGMVFIFDSVPYIFFIIRTTLKPRSSFLYNLLVSIGLLIPECLILYYFNISEIPFFRQRDEYARYFKLTQMLLFPLFFLIEYLMQLFVIKKEDEKGKIENKV
jgi:hypothetical protein